MKLKTTVSLIITACLILPSFTMAKDSLIEDANLESAIKNKLEVSELTVQNLTDLNYLLIYKDYDIKSLNGLENASNLSQFLIQYNEVSDLTPLRNLNNLWFLSLNHNEITDITPISNLKKLRSLGLDFNNIVDISALRGLRLGSLSLESNPYLKDISVLSQVQNIHKLNLANTSITDLTPLENQPINSLNISDTEVSDLTPLEKITSLNTLYVKNLPMDAHGEVVLERLKARGVEIDIPPDYISKSIIKVNGENPNFDVAPILSYDRTMVPMRKIFELLGVSVGWDEKTSTITADSGTTKVRFTIGSRKVTVNDRDLYFEVKPQLYQNTTMVPLRFITEILGTTVEWDEVNSIINIKSKG
ncbi:stalk domain-containing protein [Paenibacillus contaminans]|uniref:stalk domain-containing protein n=1 Tax=Paenibacillus contaminans TaxID=450362 RepID=UPI0013143D96|nr:stalk domain-containing protein [Paenibacillus contaminans]